jgi:hypothetical protein
MTPKPESPLLVLPIPVFVRDVGKVGLFGGHPFFSLKNP